MATNDHFMIKNQSGGDVYIYDWDESLNTAVKTAPVAGGGPLPNGHPPLDVPMQVKGGPRNAARRLYIAAEPLNGSCNDPKEPVAPDSFTPWNDGGIMYSFVEYNYEPAHSRYTFDLSYIDTFSYPVTVKFSGDSSYKGYVENFEYGFKSLAAVISALQGEPTYPWGDLVWPKDNPANPGNADWPTGIYRVIGPNKVWLSDSFGLSAYAPAPYHNFVKSLPYNGTQLFSPKTNFDGWKTLETEPASTGYTEALRSAATADTNGKYGFFCYPLDNANGEFALVPLQAQCALTIYPYNT